MGRLARTTDRARRAVSRCEHCGDDHGCMQYCRPIDPLAAYRETMARLERECIAHNELKRRVAQLAESLVLAEEGAQEPTPIETVEVIVNDLVRDYASLRVNFVDCVKQQGRDLRKALREALGIAECFNMYVPKFPAVGGPTLAERRLVELGKLAEEPEGHA